MFDAASPSALRSSTDDARISLPEIISALSFALDLTEGAVHGHAVRSCVLGMRIAHEAGVASRDMFDLYYALLLKDVGCSSNSARMCQIVAGDDRMMKANSKTLDWSPGVPKVANLRLLWNTVLPEATIGQRVTHIVAMGRTQTKDTRALITMRCERGANILRKLDFSERAAEAVHSLDEHWDGNGYPLGLKGRAIPRLARILAIAQNLDVFATRDGAHAAIEVLRERSGKWFDPELVRVAISLHASGTLWTKCLPVNSIDETQKVAMDLGPSDSSHLPRERIDEICEAFADVVDAKSPYTFRHSLGVTDAAATIAYALGLRGERLDFVRRGALLHDIGKLSISNTILDKTGKLTNVEWEAMKDHPVQTQKILSRVSAFAELAVVAGQHHEKLDGSGYPDGLTAEHLSLEARIIAVADVYAALSEDRPYRAGLSMDKIVSIMTGELPHRLDTECFEALMGALSAVQTPSFAALEPALV